MMIEVRASNCYAFEKEIIFSMKADMRNKKFAANVHRENNFNVLKTAGIYGPNNAGKTCLIKCIRAIKRVLLNEKSGSAMAAVAANISASAGKERPEMVRRIVSR